MQQYWLPTIPYSLVDAVNRRTAATGSPQYAMLAANSNYNGYSVTVSYNSYRKYHICEYWWAGRHVLARGTLEQALRAGVAEYQRGARGTEVHTMKLELPGARIAETLGYVPWSEESERAHHTSYQDPRWSELSQAFSYERHGLAPAVGMLVNSSTVEEYRIKLDAFLESQRRLRVRPCGRGPSKRS